MGSTQTTEAPRPPEPTASPTAPNPIRVRRPGGPEKRVAVSICVRDDLRLVEFDALLLVEQRRGQPGDPAAVGVTKRDVGDGPPPVGVAAGVGQQRRSCRAGWAARPGRR